MYLEKLIFRDGRTVEEKFNELDSNQQMALMEEIKKQKDMLKESKIVAETEMKSLEDKKNEILNELKEKYNLESIEDAQKKVDELNKEIVQSLTEFAERNQSE